MSLPESLERAATELTALANQIRPANGDPDRLLEELDQAQAGELLRWILGAEPEAAGELIDAWADSESGQQVLLGVSEEGIAKAGRKLLRRAHHRLRSTGVAVPEAVPTPSARRRVVGGQDPFEFANLSTPDFRGARVGYLADRHPSGGARLFEIRFDESRGILDFKVYNAGRSKIRGFLRSLSSARSHRLFEVPREALCALVRRASLAQPIDRPLPSGFIEWRGRLFPEAVEENSTPGGLARVALARERAERKPEEALAEVVELVVEGEVGPWPPPTQWVSDWMERGRDRVEDLEGDALATAIESLTAEIAMDLVDETDADLLSRHLEELAWVRWQMDLPTSAASLLVVADGSTSDPAVAERLARARVESLLAPFFGELRATGVVKEND